MGFGDYLKQKRTEKGYNLRKLADLVGIAPAYLSDIEKGKRNSPSEEKMQRIIEILELSESEIAKMKDLAAEERHNSVASDISDYVTKNETVRVALRRAKELNLGNDEWIKIIEEMEKNKGK